MKGLILWWLIIRVWLFYVFYNGEEERPEREVLKLSDAFQVPVKEGKFEWTAVVLNINHGHNQKLLEQCSILGEYGILIGKIREFRQDAQELKEAIVEAIEYCISNDILKEFLLEHKSEVTDMLKIEYDEAKTMAHIREDSYEEGEQAGVEKGTEIKLIEMVCRKLSKNKSVEQIADELEENIDNIRSICEVAQKFAPEYDKEKIYESIKK